MVKAVCSQPESRLFSRLWTSWALLHLQLTGYGAQMHDNFGMHEWHSEQSAAVGRWDGKGTTVCCICECNCRLQLQA